MPATARYDNGSVCMCVCKNLAGLSFLSKTTTNAVQFTRQNITGNVSNVSYRLISQ